jgi:predicted anti-sigma-YlaC factor YlaD
MSSSACNLIEPLLGAYLDGEVPAETADSMAEHLAACEQCRGVLERIARTDVMVRAMRPAFPSEAEWAATERRIMARSRARSAWQATRTAALAAAAALAIGAIVWIAQMIDRSAAPAVPAGGAPTAQSQDADLEEGPIEISIERG